ncbi:MAG: hypothetical protein AAF573_04620 [Bacteroidota bacterium]
MIESIGVKQERKEENTDAIIPDLDIIFGGDFPFFRRYFFGFLFRHDLME